MSPKALALPHGQGSRWTLFVGAAILLHCVITAIRVPHVVVGRRLAAVAELQEQGEARWLLATAKMGGTDAIEQLLATTSDDAVIPSRGPFKGALEFAPRLLWPRLVAREDYLPAGKLTHQGRPIAPFVLISDGVTLRVEPR